MKDDILYHPVINFVVLLIGLSVCGAFWGVAGSAADAAVNMAMGPMPMQGPFDGLEDLFSIVWIGVRTLFWLVIGLAGTAVVLFALASIGVLTWVVQQLARGFWYVSAQIHKTVDEMTTSKDPTEETPVAKTPEGKPATVRDILANHESRITTLETKQ